MVVGEFDEDPFDAIGLSVAVFKEEFQEAYFLFC
jgi:hypothetical protein